MHPSYIPRQTVPYSLYPWLHVQVKLPGVLVHVALESQLLVASAHSSISEVRGLAITWLTESVVLTFTDGFISSVSLVTCTGEASRSVGTCSIRVTVVSSISTLINI